MLWGQHTHKDGGWKNQSVKIIHAITDLEDSDFAKIAMLYAHANVIDPEDVLIIEILLRRLGG